MYQVGTLHQQFQGRIRQITVTLNCQYPGKIHPGIAAKGVICLRSTWKLPVLLILIISISRYLRGLSGKKVLHFYSTFAMYLT